jgi:hypothetical protein
MGQSAVGFAQPNEAYSRVQWVGRPQGVSDAYQVLDTQHNLLIDREGCITTIVFQLAETGIRGKSEHIDDICRPKAPVIE